MTASFSLPPADTTALRRVSPTDVAQFIRLDQCQRYLRLRLTERVCGADFIHAYGVSPQDPPPLMMRGGEAFEDQVCEQIKANRPTRDLKSSRAARDDGAIVRTVAETLPAGQEIVLLQPRLVATVGSWTLIGDVDVLRFSRSEAGALDALIVDIKSSALSKVEHRLQIAFYARMLTTVLGSSLTDSLTLSLGVHYRGDDAASDKAERDRFRNNAERLLGTDLGYLELVEDATPYLEAVDQLVTGHDSTAERILKAEFDELPFHLTYRCDWCRYNPLCMKWAAEHDDLSLVPHLSENDKLAIQRAGVKTAKELSVIKIDGNDGALQPNPEKADLAAKLAVTWPVGARLDELVQRARRYRAWKGDPVTASNYLKHRGYGSLPYCGEQQNPNLVRVYIDAQHDGQTGHLYLLGALVAAAEGGVVPASRRAAIVRMTERPPVELDDERELLLGWIDATLRSIVELAAPDAAGERNAPIHLIFFNRFDQELFLDALARHAESILTATPLFDFLTQMAAFDSPIATFLVDEIRELRNYPMLSQSLQSVARFLGFSWMEPLPFRRLFHERLFDYTGKFDDGDPTAPEGSPWYTSRSRFDSQIPVEYAYAAWGALPEVVPGESDPFEGYRAVGREELIAFQRRRLEAMEHIANDFTGNRDTTKTAFSLPDLSTFEQKGGTLAQALVEFVMIERFVELAAWKSARLAPPERRVLAGISLIGRYDEDAQSPEVRLRMKESRERHAARQRLEAELEPSADDAKPKLPKEQREATKWSVDGLEVRLEIDVTDVDCGLQEALDLSTLRDDAPVILTPRWTFDGRLPEEQRRPLQPTPKQMLYGMRGRLKRIEVERDESGMSTRAVAIVQLQHGFPKTLPGGFIFGCFGSMERPLEPGETFVLDEDVNDWSGFYARKVADGLVAGGANTLYDRLTNPGADRVEWSEAAAAAQARFLAGFEKLARLGHSVTFEPSKREYIAQHGDTPVLLVQGPPGTGKSFTTAYALFARLQGAMAADRDFRIVVSCHTHKAIDVVIGNLVEMRERLELIRFRHPALFARYFDERLLDVPIFRGRPNGEVRSGVVELKRKSEDGAVNGLAVDRFTAHRWSILGATPNAVHGILTEKWKDPFGHDIADCLVLDEASQLSLPTAMIAALPLKADGQVIVVGDHRQMPPIVKHDWSSERKRTFQEFKAFESLFLTLLGQTPRPPLIQFAESFRLHQAMADFLRENIYRHDGIDFRSRKDWRMAPIRHDDEFVAATLSNEHPLVVVTHDERSSQLSNTFERDLVLDLSNALFDERVYGTGEEESDGFGIVVPHRAQRAAFSSALLAYPDRVGKKTVIADTVERFQGDEREVIIVSATESDPSYLLAASGFLLEPRRLTVALSRAKRKLIVVASVSIFELFSPDEETFTNAQLWKNLLRRACTVPLWSGMRNGHSVQVWGSEPYGDGRDIT